MSENNYSNSNYQQLYTIPQVINTPVSLNIQLGINATNVVNVMLPRIINGLDVIEEAHVLTPLFPVFQQNNTVEILGEQSELL